MHIQALVAENIKRLKRVEITPDGAVIELTGRNGQGKSSILDAMRYTLGGARDIPSSPIRRGETHARAELNLGAYKVTRTFTAQEDGGFNTYLEITSAEGAKFSKPQDLLNALVGDLTFDPLAFTTMKAADQVALLQRFVPSVDFAADAVADRKDFEVRTAVNREAKELRVQVAAFRLPEDVPAERVDEQPILQEISTAGARNLHLERLRQARAADALAVERLQTSAQEKFAQADQARRDARRLDEEAEQLAEQAAEQSAALSALEPLREPINTAELTARLQQVQAANALFVQAERRAGIAKRAEAKEAESKALTDAMEARKAARAKAVAEADMPVPGLGFGAGEVTLHGLPFEQASNAEQLRASIAIAAAMNPKLRVIWVQDASRLDSAAMQLLTQYAEEHDLQVWAEVVESGRPAAIVIEDGQIAAPMLQAAE